MLFFRRLHNNADNIGRIGAKGWAQVRISGILLIDGDIDVATADSRLIIMDDNDDENLGRNGRRSAVSGNACVGIGVDSTKRKSYCLDNHLVGCPSGYDCSARNDGTDLRAFGLGVRVLHLGSVRIGVGRHLDRFRHRFAPFAL